jgi:hypothetical protein
LSDTPTDLCQCPLCGRMHRHLQALERADLERLWRVFRAQAIPWLTQDIRINEWLQRMIADAKN